MWKKRSGFFNRGLMTGLIVTLVVILIIAFIFYILIKASQKEK